MKILLLDLETSPNTAYVWGIWQENIPLQRLIESSKVLCWTAKWYGEDEVYFQSIYSSKEKTMLKRIHQLLDAADAVVTYNGNKFDLPVLNKEFFLHGFSPPAPYKSVDLYKTVRSKFRFVSNKLDYVCQQLKLGKKVDTDFSLWVRCMEKDPDAWKVMEDYNTNDVLLLESLYDKIKPWIKGHPNHSVYTNSLVCPRCGDSHIQSRGFTTLQAHSYRRFQCKGCGHWFRSNQAEKQESKEKYIDL